MKKENNSWDDVIDVLFDGTVEEIKNIKSPRGNKFLYAFNPKAFSLEIRCGEEGYLCRIHGCHSIPNFYIFMEMGLL